MTLLTCFCKSSSKISSIVTPSMKLSRVSSSWSMLTYSLSSDDISVGSLSDCDSLEALPLSYTENRQII